MGIQARDGNEMADRYFIRWSIGKDEYPVEIVSTEQEALARARELFVEHGRSLKVEICLNDLSSVLYGRRILDQLNQGRVQLP
jgi:hypothetical protein